MSLLFAPLGAFLFCFATFRKLGWWNILAVVGLLLMMEGIKG